MSTALAAAPATSAARDRAILRRLAERYVELCHGERNRALVERWYAHNGLRQAPPMVLCFPEGAWNEIPLGTPEEAVQDESLRWIAWSLRSRIYTMEVMQDDQAFEPVLRIGWPVKAGDWGVAKKRDHAENRGAAKIHAVFDDLKRAVAELRPRQPSVDRAASLAFKAKVEDLLGDLLPVRMETWGWWTDGMTIDVIDLIGLERLMTAMVDEPDELHALMAWMRDERLAWQDWYEREGLICPRSGDTYVGSGGQGFTDELPGARHPWPEKLTFRHCWGFGESQETVGVGPRMFKEFILPYQVPLLARYGLNCYGCCEGLHQRIDAIMAQVPRLRRVSVSPWADQRIMAEKLGRTAIFSRKPNPALVCVSFDEEKIRADIRTTCEAARGCQLELILKDTHTVQGDPTRLSRWVQIARQEIDKHWR